MLIRDVSILSGNSLLGGRDIKIDGNRIASIGAGLSPDRGEEILEGRGKLAIPGLVNSHTHLAMTLFRGYADDMELLPWLRERIWPLESRLSAQDVRVGALLGCLEQIRSGITCFCDMYFFPDETAQAAREMGLRAIVGAGILDAVPSLLPEAEPFLRRWKGDELITPAIGPHAVQTCSEETLLRCKELAERFGTMIHIHLAETRKEVEDFCASGNAHPVRYLDRLGILGPSLVAAHCIWISGEEVSMLGKRGVNVVHCPVSNHKLASGFAPVEEMLGAKVNVILGTDGASSNNSLNLFQEMKVAAITEKCVRARADALPAWRVWQMATRNAYRAFRLPVGLYEGALADLALIDLQRPWFYPRTSMVSHLVYSMTGGVDTTIVNGKVLMRDGVIPGEAAILERAQECFERLSG